MLGRFAGHWTPKLLRKKWPTTLQSASSILPSFSQYNTNHTKNEPCHHKPNAGLFGQKFDNPWEGWKDPSLLDAAKLIKDIMKIGMRLRLMENDKPTEEDVRHAFPVSKIDWNALNNADPKCIQCVWVGHATALIQMAGKTFLTDPVFSQRCAPIQFAGPKRYVQPPFGLDSHKLPKIDFVLISHNHYDHLDYNSVIQLHARYGNNLRWYVPLNLKPWFTNLGINNVVELDWWENILEKDSQFNLTFTPCQHWSARKAFFDRKRSLWGSWMVEGDNGCTVWFGGDTGFCPVFKEIGKKFGGVDLALIPIGAYEPRWFMRCQHVDPFEAVQIHKDIGAKVSVAIHHSTFALTPEPVDEPARKLKAALKSSGLSSNEFLALHHGELLQWTNGRIVNEPNVM